MTNLRAQGTNWVEYSTPNKQTNRIKTLIILKSAFECAEWQTYWKIKIFLLFCENLIIWKLSLWQYLLTRYCTVWCGKHWWHDWWFPPWLECWQERYPGLPIMHFNKVQHLLESKYIPISLKKITISMLRNDWLNMDHESKFKINLAKYHKSDALWDWKEEN